METSCFLLQLQIYNQLSSLIWVLADCKGLICILRQHSSSDKRLEPGTMAHISHHIFWTYACLGTYQSSYVAFFPGSRGSNQLGGWGGCPLQLDQANTPDSCVFDLKKGTATLMITMFYMKYLNIVTSLSLIKYA